jgi:hypothetical protein
MPYRSRFNVSLSCGASLVLAVAVATASACRPADRWGTPAFNARLARFQAANNCEEAIDLVKAEHAKNDPKWYGWLIGLDLDCFAKTGKKQYVDDAQRLVEEGRRGFPRSSRLVFLKGFVYSRLGEGALAQRYYEDALKLALANIAENKDSDHSEDRLVARDAEANLGTGRRPVQ